MRLAYQGLRKSTPQLRVFHPWPRTCSISRIRPLPCPKLRRGTPLFRVRDYGVRHQSSTSSAAVLEENRDAQEVANGSQLSHDLEESTGPVQTGQSLLARDPLGIEPAVGISLADLRDPLPSPVQYGKWQYLTLNHERLAFESDFGSPSKKELRLVDSPENEDDIDLWACLLEFRRRRDGAKGIFSVWRAAKSRHRLRHVEGPAAQAFWQTVLNEALHDEQFLESVWHYAEWLFQAHGVQWPNIYTTTVSFFASGQRHEDAVRWHVRLSPSFDPGPQAFATLLQEFITDDDPVIQDILKSLYVASTHRQLYDHIVPFLYARGLSTLARKWRKLLLVHNDVPASFSARPFLRFLSSYYPRDVLVEREMLAAGLEAGPAEDGASQKLHQLVNRVHGETFGIKEKTYNDALGARWFASSWVSLDLAIQVVRAIGIRQIGPLSLQSIALRESSPDRILTRLDQLEMFKISVGPSSYAKAIKHFATAGDYENLLDLVRSDLHPDVFDDLNIQRNIMGAYLSAGNWKGYRLILAVKLAVSLDSMALFSNRLLNACLRAGNKRLILRMLDDMNANGIQVFPSTINDISVDVLDRVSPHKSDATDLDFYLALCRRITAMRFPLPTQGVQTILYRLGREGRLTDLEQLSLDVLRHYTSFQASDRATMNVHESDLPELLKDESPYQSFQILPRDFYLRHELHPIQLIFDAKLQSSIVRWGFRWAFARPHGADRPVSSRLSGPPDRFYFARGIRLLALLRDKGVHVQKSTLRKATLLRLAELYGSGEGLPPQIASARLRNQLTLAEAKQLCDTAYGLEWLPPMEELVDALLRQRRRQ